MALRLGAAERRRSAYSDLPLSPVARAREPILQLAVFQVGPTRCAMPCNHVAEAVAPLGMVGVPPSLAPTIGLLSVQVDGGAHLVPVVCARQMFGLAYPARVTDGVVLVLRPTAARPRWIGLRVDDVLAVLDLDPAQVQAAPQGFAAFAPWLRGVIEVVASGVEGRESVLVQLLDAERFDTQAGGVAPAAIEAAAIGEAALAAEGQATEVASV